MYECDSRCFDNTNGHICKHIHRIHSLQRGKCNEITTEPETHDDSLWFPPDSSENGTQQGIHFNVYMYMLMHNLRVHVHIIIIDSYCHDTDLGTSSELETTQTLLTEIGESVTKHKHSLTPYLPHINSMLRSVLLKCQLAGREETHSNVAEFSNKTFIPPGKKPDHQWRFQKTSKPPARKKNASILK